MTAKNLFRIYVLVFGIACAAVEYQREPDKPLIVAFGLGVFIALLLPGIVASHVAASQFVAAIVFPVSLIFWVVVSSIAKSGKKPVHHLPPVPGPTRSWAWKKRTRVYYEDL